MNREQARRKQRRDEGIECVMHAWQKHGKEAEELRKGIEDVIEGWAGLTTGCTQEDVDSILFELRKLVDKVDARDSLAYLERKPKRPPVKRSNG